MVFAKIFFCALTYFHMNLQNHAYTWFGSVMSRIFLQWMITDHLCAYPRSSMRNHQRWVCVPIWHIQKQRTKIWKDGSISLHIIASIVFEYKFYVQLGIKSKKLNGTGQHGIKSHHAQGIVIKPKKIPPS